MKADDFVPGRARAIEPRRLDTIVSLRLPADLAEKLFALAAESGETLSGLLRRTAQGLVEQPIGWRCEHMNLTGPRGVIGSVSTDCGCTPTPVYDAAEIRRVA